MHRESKSNKSIIIPSCTEIQNISDFNWESSELSLNLISNNKYIPIINKIVNYDTIYICGHTYNIQVSNLKYSLYKNGNRVKSISSTKEIADYLTMEYIVLINFDVPYF